MNHGQLPNKDSRGFNLGLWMQLGAREREAKLTVDKRLRWIEECDFCLLMQFDHLPLAHYRCTFLQAISVRRGSTYLERIDPRTRITIVEESYHISAGKHGHADSAVSTFLLRQIYGHVV